MNHMVTNEPIVTFYESRRVLAEDDLHQEEITAVWELDGLDHRNVLRHPIFLREITEEMTFQEQRWTQMGKKIKDSMEAQRSNVFAPKVSRVPQHDSDCNWDYFGASCGWPQYCEYNYSFGDVTLGQSCRLKRAPENSVPVIQPCKCRTSCFTGICQYELYCPEAHAPFGVEHGWWGPCTKNNTLNGLD